MTLGTKHDDGANKRADHQMNNECSQFQEFSDDHRKKGNQPSVQRDQKPRSCKENDGPSQREWVFLQPVQFAFQKQ